MDTTKKKTIWSIIAALIAVVGLVWLVVAVFMTEQEEKPAQERDVPAKSQIRHDALLRFFDINNKEMAAISIEIADSDEERMAGLMGRTHMEEKEGMLFLFDRDEERSFWMANTPLPLDIIFVNSALKIVKIHRNTRPYSDESLPSNSPAKFVVEVNAGFCDRFGVTEGQAITWN